MKPFIVISDGFDKKLFDQLTQIEEFDVHPSSKLTPEELEKLLPKVNGLVIRSATEVTSTLLKNAPNLKIVIRAGEGTDNIDKDACKSQGVKVANTPGANSNSAAEHAISLMFTVLRKTAWAHQSMKGGKWEKSKFLGTELSNKKIGIIGFGRIGQIVAERLSGFRPEVIFFDPYIKSSDIPYAKAATNLEQIFRECDIITLHLPKIPQTQNLINKSLLELMKEDAILINAARGGIVNEDDLFNHLKAGKILGAGLDVFENEPLSDTSRLRALDNLVLTPHLGASTREAQVRVGQMALDQLKEFFFNNNLVNEVTS